MTKSNSMTDVPTRWNQAWRTALVSGAMGGFLGLVDSVVTLGGLGRVGIPPNMHLLASVCHVEAFALGGLLLGAVIPRRTGRLRDLDATPVAAGVSLAFFLSAAVYLNMQVLPAFDSPISLAADAALALAAGVLATLVCRHWPTGDVSRSFARPWCVLVVGTWIVAFAWGHVAESESPDIETTATPAPELPHILFILVDTVRADHLSAYGYGHPTSPWLDALADEGVLFERALSASCHTKPSTASIFSSRYPSAHGARRLDEGLSFDVPTFVESIRAAGYRTAAFSANGLVSPTFGFGKGFEAFFRQESPYVLRLGLSQILERAYYGVPVAGLLPGAVLGSFLGWERLLTPARVAEAGFLQTPEDFEIPGLRRSLLGWLDGIEGDPFFAYLHVLEPHDPYEPPADLRSEFEARIGGATDDSNFPHYVGGFLPFDPATPLGDAERLGLVARYDAELAATDAALEELVADVRVRAGDRDLLVIFTSDHGEEFYEHGGWGHGQSLYEELIHVPLVMSWPGGLPSGTRVEAPVSMIDLAPTILEILGLPEVPAFQGRSLVSRMTGGEDVPTSPIFSEIHWGGHFAHAYQDASGKYIESTSGGDTRRFFFDLSMDPGEMDNLVETDPARSAALRDSLESILRRSEAMAMGSVSVAIEGDVEDRMRTLGYID